MTDVLLEKIEHIEKMIIELNSKIDNFMGYEDLSDGEKKELEQIRKEMENGEYAGYEDIFGEN